MKKIIYSLVSIIALIATFNSCVEDTDYETPQIACVEPVLTGNNVPLLNIVTLWVANLGESSVYTFDEDYEDYITVYVTSSDETGNFYKELFVQDSPTEPTIAIKLSIDTQDLYTKYQPGRKLYVYLKGLAVGLNQSGELMIAEANGTGMSDYIRENKAKKNIMRNCDAVAITPLNVDTPIDISGSHLGMYVRFDNVQFDHLLLGTNFTDPLESFDTHLTINSCIDYSTIKLETSSFADFKNVTIPEGMGSVEGVISRDYGDEFYVLRVNGPEAFSFDGVRCDPNCTYAVAQGTTNLFSEDFESLSTNDPVSGNGWTNYIEEGTETWEIYTDSNSLGKSARIGSFSSGDASSIAWLITPAIDFDAQDAETFVFQTSNSFSDGSILQLLYSTDWDGAEANITSATWDVFPVGYIVADDEYYVDWFESGIIDLSCEEGVTYFAFKYTGSGVAEFDGTYELDEISIDYTP